LKLIGMITRLGVAVLFLPDAWGPMFFRRVVVDVFWGLIKSAGMGLLVTEDAEFF
jgi:hypothetical protein